MDKTDGTVENTIQKLDENPKKDLNDSQNKNNDESPNRADNDGNLHDTLSDATKTDYVEKINKMEAIERVKSIIEKTRVAFLTTISGKQLVSRPMFVHGKAFDGTLWFITRRDSPKVTEIEKDSRVNVSFGEKSYVSLSGRAFVIDSDLKKKAYWGKSEGKFFGTTYNDPSLVLIKVEALSAEFWERAEHRSFIMQPSSSFSYNSSATVEF